MLNRDNLISFLFRGLLFEAEAGRFQSAGIQVGASSVVEAESLLEQSLAPFGIHRRNSALEMARLYALLFCFENEIRDLLGRDFTRMKGQIRLRVFRQRSCR